MTSTRETMTMPAATRGRPALFVTAVLVLLSVGWSSASAQSGFLFKRPVSTVSLMGGWASAGEGSDLFEFTREQLTVDEGDFAAPALMVEVAARATERLDVALGLEHASRTVDSEMRDWVTQDDLPIRQSTQFSRTRLLGTVKAYLLPRGRRVSRFSWVPHRWSPYIGGGGGLSWYEFVQSGDFVDFDTLDIFEEAFEETGHGWTAHAVGGIQLSLSPRFLVRGEYRYIWGDAELGEETFQGFEDLDVSGSSILFGVAVRL